MRDVEHEALQNEEPVEFIPLPGGDEHPAPGEISSRTFPGRAAPTDKARRSGAWRFLLVGGALCVIAALVVSGLVLLRPQPSQQASHFAPPSTASTTSNSAATSSSVSTDFSTNMTIVNGVVYALSENETVYAMHADNGSVLWQYSANEATEMNGAPLVDNGIVYILAETSDVGPGTLYTLRASDGARLWSYNANDYLSSLTIAGGIAYVTTYDNTSDSGSIMALHANNGTPLWYSAIPGSSYDTPIVENGVVYTTVYKNNSGSGTIYALRASDGAQLWHTTANTAFSYILTAANGVLYVSSAQGIAALQASNGRQLWSDALQGDIASPLLVNGVLYFTATKVSMETSSVSMSRVNALSQMGTTGNLLRASGAIDLAPSKLDRPLQPMSFMKQTIPAKEGLSTVYAVRASDGAILWNYQMSKAYGNNWANWLTLANGTVYVGTYVSQDASYIYALRSSDGSQLWRQATVQGMSANVFIANGVIYLASYVNDGSVYAGTGALYALRASDGSRLWYHAINWVVNNPPMLVGTTLYVTTAADDIYAFRSSNGSQMWHVYMNTE
jgi:outer membrane protein assembly factor BamB